jgi:phospholipid transport system substrate-binding protein
VPSVTTRSVALAACFAWALPAGAEERSPTAVVGRLNATLAGVLEEAEALGWAGRVARLTPAVTEAFDVPFMAEKSLGQRWKTLTEAERGRWIEVSREFSVANYAANFDHDSGQTIELLGAEPAANGTTIVRTRIVDPGAESIAMSYRLHRSAGGWRIIDVYLKGTVSELALRRADYTSVLARDGFEALVATMRGRIADLAAGRGKRQGA